MTHHLRSEQTPRAGRHPRWHDASRAGHRLRTAIELGVLLGLFLTAVVSAMVGAPLVLIGAVAGAWLVLATMVGPRYVLDAGCAFTLLVVGVLVVIDLATGSLAAFLP